MSSDSGGLRLASASELARELGVSTRWVYGQVDEHGMPAYRLGSRALRFDRAAVLSWLEQRRIGDWVAAESCADNISHD